MGRGRYDILAEDGYFKMEKTSFQKLDIYRLAEVLADNIWEIVANWDRFAQDTVGRQLVRAADSIGANIAGSAPERRPGKRKLCRDFKICENRKRFTF